jgi:hypothetical protein
MNTMMRRDAGDMVGMKHVPGRLARPRPQAPLTGGDAGKAPSADPKDVQQRSNASPSNPNTL